MYMPLLVKPRAGVAGDFEVLKYKAGTLVKQRFDQDCMEPTGDILTSAKLKTAKPPALFGGIAASLGDLDSRIDKWGCRCLARPCVRAPP